jgi:hypothetical protein
LNIDQLNIDITTDLTKLSKKISKKVTLAVTCLDQFEEKITVVTTEGNIVALEREQFLKHLLDKTPFDHYLLTYGPTREDCQPITKDAYFTFAECDNKRRVDAVANA